MTMRQPQPTLITRFLLLMLAIPLLTATAFAGESELTQRDWMLELVDTLGLSFGLPDTPTDADYLLVLSGLRQFRFEAEDVYTPEEDEVSRMSFRNFGDFSGSAWLNGLSRPTRVQLRFTLPLGGRYRLTAGLRNGEHLFRVGGQELVVTGSATFTGLDVGEIDLEAGPQEVVVMLPPGGAIDYIELAATGLKPISPLHGWQPGTPLQWDDIRITLLQVFSLGDLLEETGTLITVEAEQLASFPVETFTITDIGYFGRPSGDLWLRTGALSARLDVSVELRDGGYYQPVVRLLGNPVAIDINRQTSLEIAGHPYLEDHPLPAQFFVPGTNLISLEFPPGGGLDRLSLTRLDSSASAGNRLLGLAPQSAPPNRSDLAHLTRLVAAFGSDR
ncbi:MAG: hypothetical protein RQ723_05370 [Desulfuromonadales bacterium]|nr:hypothetical protein [Desulfuromonadales bacterium]